MKPSHLVLLAAAALAAGAASWLARDASGARGGAGHAQASAALEPLSSPRSAEDASALDPRGETAALDANVHAREGADRRKVDPPAAGGPLPGEQGAREVTVGPADAATAVGPERAAEEQRRELEMLRDRAERIAHRVGLDADEQQRLADLLFEQRDRRLALVAEMRSRPPSRTRDADLRTSVLELREWLHRELALRLGAARAQEVRSAFEDRSFGRTPPDEGE